MHSEYNIKQYNADTYNISDPDILEIIWLAYKQGFDDCAKEICQDIYIKNMFMPNT